ncbi:MAG TPA: ATP synthase F1 subunit delta [Nitrospira sp.]|nr:ATP synthase F1 subunit delta [Nitrospira sp.]
MIKTAVARRYAQALFELLDQSNIEAMRSTLQGLAEALKTVPSLRHVVASPAFAVEEKIAVLTELGSRLGCPPAGRAFLSQLLKKNRVGFLPEIADAFSALVDRAKGTQPVIVSSAAPLAQPEQERIKARLRDALKREVDLTFHTDPASLAGLQIHIGSRVVDSTIRGRLDTLRTALARD